ncbi:hypothetical protein AO066_18400 [Pseudomonas fluorescens]|nr:hypothetical protein AO066_18400 [Pseudomonas fluorescens]RMP88862.1 hypothetical protein ALQ17_00071 [Pseudomonas fluorescens]
MSQIKERPILFSGPMIRALLEGRKTVTRRPVKGLGLQWLDDFTPEYVADAANSLCPYGQPGDRLWVRETWGLQVRNYGGGTGEHIVYRATNPDAIYCKSAEGREYPVKWKPSIHMHRHSCRILLEITDVRVERLQDITEDQAKAEGCFFTDYGQQCAHGGTGWKDIGICPAVVGHQQRTGWAWDKTTSHEECLGSPRWAFANLWNATGGDWDANPWVWVVEFKRVTP